MKTNYYYQCPPDDFIMRLMRSSKGFIIISEDGRVVCSERATLTPQMTTAWNEYCHIHNQDDIDGTIIDFWRYLRSVKGDKYGYIDISEGQDQFPKLVLQVIKPDKILVLLSCDGSGVAPACKCFITFKGSERMVKEPTIMQITDKMPYDVMEGDDTIYMDFSTDEKISSINSLISIIGLQSTVMLKEIMRVACKRVKEEE